ncbi:MAG: GxxExxY protein [Bacteroidetes bacterium]|nr:GxxExxY protein [Bacteroidota bacterium]
MKGVIDINDPINQLFGKLVDIAYHVHTNLGPGLFESVYEDVTFWKSKKPGFAERQKPILLSWDGKLIDRPAFKADIIVETKVLIEIKSVESLAPVHLKQVETYLRLSGIKLGLLLNFNSAYFKDGIRRIVNKL